jgi:hypothetical protein
MFQSEPFSLPNRGETGAVFEARVWSNFPGLVIPGQPIALRAWLEEISQRSEICLIFYIDKKTFILILLL